MKILQVAYKSKISGGEKVLFDLAARLRERGHEVSAVCPSPGPLPEELRRRGIPVGIIPFRKTYDLRAALRLARFIRKENIEVLHSHSMLTNIIARWAGHRAGVPVSVSTEHLTMELARGGRGRGAGERARAAYYRFLDNHTSRWNQAVIAVSAAVRRDLVEQGMNPERVRVIRNGIEPLRCDPARARALRRELGLADDAPVVGMVGRLSPQKDYPTFLKAAREVGKKFPRCVFLIAGDGYLRGRLEDLSRELNIPARVKFLGYRRDIAALTSLFDIFVLSSLWEGLPLVVLEAMSLGKPVAATAVPGTAEAVREGETGFLVPLRDSRALAGRIGDLLGDPAAARRMGQAGRERVEKEFSLERVVNEHEALYLELKTISRAR